MPKYELIKDYKKSIYKILIIYFVIIISIVAIINILNNNLDHKNNVSCNIEEKY